jgi:hypothetical protein
MSEKSKYLREKPCNPAKCNGKKVRFTPKKIKKKNNNIMKDLMPIENIKDHHKDTPKKIPKTAPRLKTM